MVSINATNETYYQANDGSITVNPTGGTPPYTYSWSNGSTAANQNNLSTANYSVNVTDIQGCSDLVSNITINFDSCAPTLIQTNNPTLNSGIYQVGNYISSNGILSAGSTVSFKAGNYIELLSDFDVITGSEFEALIESCQ